MLQLWIVVEIGLDGLEEVDGEERDEDDDEEREGVEEEEVGVEDDQG